jgi:hypothetical protein
MNGMTDGAETDTDCGGGDCGPCADGEDCAVSSDCLSNVCEFTCTPASCANGMKDGDETDVDCGGAVPNGNNPDCAPCAILDDCEMGSDCESMSCVNGVCLPPSCSDDVMNGDETGMDCGGSVCGPCPPGEGCTTSDDCIEKICSGDVCLPPLCSDGVKNGNESDIDCGGSCNTNCPAGQKCLSSSDCVTGLCGPVLPGTCLCPPGMTIAPISGGGTYCIDASEVTREEYQTFFFANPSIPNLPAACVNNLYPPSADWPPTLGELPLPVAYVDWCDAYSYCEYLGRHLCGKVGGGTNDPADFADPSQSEWFNACTAQGVSTYPYGSSYIAGTCNGNDPGSGLMSEMFTMPCLGGSPGLYNMSGNAAEWEDSCDMNGQCRIRGGSYSSDPAGLACDASDFRARLDNTNNDIGIRCCL